MDENGLAAAFEQVLAGPMGRVLAAIWGALWGSFFNVVIVRVPAGESVVKPPSHCRSCRQVLRWYDNVPILSYVLLRGRCRRCGARYSPRYALVELLIALLALAIHHIYVVGAAGPIGLRLAQFVILSLFVGLICALALIDLETMRIPNAITYPGIPVAVVLSLFMGHPGLWDGLVGAACGYLVIRLIADGYEWLTGRQGMGYGDAKLLALIGGLLGWRVLLPTLFLAAFQGSVIGVGALVWVRRRAARQARPVSPSAQRESDEDDRESDEDATAHGSGDSSDDQLPQEEQEAVESLRYARIPFGPFLGVAAIELVLFRGVITPLFPYLF